jgi:hypothetical protein
MGVIGNIVGSGLVATLFATSVGSYFQERAWRNEKAVTRRQEDATNAFNVEQNISEFIDARWAAASRIRSALDPEVSEDEWNLKNEANLKQIDQWNLNLTRLAGQLAFYVDLPFGVSSADRRKQINDSIDCLSYTLDFKSNGADINPRSASHLLQIIDHCHDRANQDLEHIVANKARVKVICGKVPPPSGTEKDICNFSVRISHIWWLNNVLRCTILQRAGTIRDSNTKYSRYLMPEALSRYDDQEQQSNDCVRDYRSDDVFGLARSRGQ